MKMIQTVSQAALLAGVMVLAMLTACGGGSGSGTSTIGEEFETNTSQRLTLSVARRQKTGNDTDLRNKALAQLAKINEDGTIAPTDASTTTGTLSDDKKL